MFHDTLNCENIQYENKICKWKLNIIIVVVIKLYTTNAAFQALNTIKKRNISRTIITVMYLFFQGPSDNFRDLLEVIHNNE